jgi:hypothetical protein
MRSKESARKSRHSMTRVATSPTPAPSGGASRPGRGFCPPWPRRQQRPSTKAERRPGNLNWDSKAQGGGSTAGTPGRLHTTMIPVACKPATPAPRTSLLGPLRRARPYMRLYPGHSLTSTNVYRKSRNTTGRKGERLRRAAWGVRAALALAKTPTKPYIRDNSRHWAAIYK